MPAVCHKVSKSEGSHERVCALCELVLHLVRLQLLQGEQRQTQLVLLKHNILFIFFTENDLHKCMSKRCITWLKCKYEVSNIEGINTYLC